MDQSTSGELINDYQSYVDSCTRNGVTNIESESTWTDNQLNPNTRLAFIPSLPGIAAMGRDILMRNRNKIASAAASGPKMLLSTSIEILKEEGINKAKAFVFEGMGGGNSIKGGVPSTPSNSDGSRSGLLGDYTPLPMKAELKPGLVNRAYISLVNDPTNKYATTHILGYGLTMPTDTPTTQYFDRVLVPVLQQKAQASVNFRIDLSILTTAKVTKYLNDVTNALNIVYFNTSLLSYASIPNNRDVGLLALRSMITADDIDFIQQLQQHLGSIPIPPNLNTTAFFLNQNFRDSEVGDGIFKLMPISFNDTSNTSGVVTGFNGTNSSALTACLTALKAPDNREIASVLLRIAPSWMRPVVYDPPATTVYSKLAMTIFANSVHKYYNGSDQYAGPLVNTEDDPLLFLSFDPEIDGVAMALCNHLIGTNLATSIVQPSLGMPVSTRMTVSGLAYYSNRFSYVLRSSDSAMVWRESNRSIEAAFGRQERSRAYLGTEYYAKLPGSLRYNGLTSSILNESVKDMLSWILSMDTIKSQKTSGKSWNKRSKDKSKVDSDSQS